ncbi:MAG: DoxX family protein [Saprospiraceae bacterium]|nr:DoxX family protein [Saprospiraceae bacterium]
MVAASAFTRYVYANTTNLLKWTLGIVYLWFGALKFFSGLSPAEVLAKDTIRVLTFGLIPDDISLILLAIWEVTIGVLLLSGFRIRFAIKAALVHMVFTFTPLLFFPELSFTHAPYGFTIIGQYIVKNLVFIVAMMIILKEEEKK